MEIITISALCICGVMFAIFLGEQNKIYGQAFVLVLVVILIVMVVDKLYDLFGLIQIVEDITGVSGTYMKMLLKMSGIIFVAECTADICEQEGYKVIGKQVLMF